ncbi:hypothetical protein [Nannocystis pusilla]|uniref:hypothetical protein n=1 Tax=Nannocystis pusilla TaxID=889268 RepID=UPI003B76707E
MGAAFGRSVERNPEGAVARKDAGGLDPREIERSCEDGLMQQSGRNRGFRSVCAVIGAAWGLWVAGCAPEDDWELTEIGVEQEMAELAAEEAWERLEAEVDEAELEAEAEMLEQEMAELAAEARERVEADEKAGRATAQPGPTRAGATRRWR